jgi:hypothetical protein
MALGDNIVSSPNLIAFSVGTLLISFKDKGECMRKKARAIILKDFYAELGEAVAKGFGKALSHPWIKIDCCPDFVTF